MGPDYKTMYFKLFSAMSDAINILGKAQWECEEMYMNAESDEDEVIEE